VRQLRPCCREARGRADDHYLRCTSPDAIDGGCEAVFATKVVFEPLVGELFRSLVQHAAPRNGDLPTSTHDGRKAHTNDRTIMVANPADPAECLGFGLTAASS